MTYYTFFSCLALLYLTINTLPGPYDLPYPSCCLTLPYHVRFACSQVVPRRASCPSCTTTTSSGPPLETGSSVRLGSAWTSRVHSKRTGRPYYPLATRPPPTNTGDSNSSSEGEKMIPTLFTEE